MLNASKYLNIVKARGESRKPLERVYRLIRQPDILKMAYMNLYANDGATTPGTDPQDIIDGMTIQRIHNLSDELGEGKFRWKPVRQAYRDKRDGGKRPLGIPGWKEKMVQEAMRLILAAYYEPQFSNLSHGFRTGRGCHTALTQITHAGGWTGTKWFIEGDIRGCFDNINHNKLIEILARDIHDDRFLKLTREMLEAGYMEDWRYYGTYSGTPQGGVVSPILANIYLNELDKYVENVLIPAYTKGDKRQMNPAYDHLENVLQYAKRKERKEDARRIKAQMREIPSGDPNDSNFRRLRYIRYADDFLLGFIGPKAEAEEIRGKLAEFLDKALRLEMSLEKTLITHATTEKARFLGYEITAPIANTKQTGKRRALNGKIQLRMPEGVLKEWIDKYAKDGKPTHRKELTTLSDYDIVKAYAIELAGIYNYYCMAINVGELANLRGVMFWSLVKTLANKHQTKVSHILTKYGTTINGLKAIKVEVAREGKEPLKATFGDLPCRRKRNPIEIPDAIVKVVANRNELLKRMMAEKCEICGSTTNVENHHIRKISDLKQKWQGKKEKPQWVERMIAMNRKTLVVCQKCHDEIHGGRYDGPRLTTL